MKKQKTQSKIIVALTAVVILLVAVSATLTFAYFTASKSANSSEMTFGTLGINTTELETTACEHAMSGTSIVTLVPGCTINLGDATDAIVVSGNIDALLRATLTVTVWQTKRYAVAADVTAERATAVGELIPVIQADTGAVQKGGVYALMSTISVSGSNAGTFAATVFDSIGAVADWTYNAADNRYYYNKVVNAGGATANIPFATTVTLSTELSNEWQGAIMEIGIVVDAIQAEHLNETTTPANKIFITKGVGNVFSDVKVGTTTAAAATSVHTGEGNATMAEMVAEIATASAWTVNMQTGVANS